MVRESVKAPLYPSDPPRVKRTHITTQMKRVQRGRCAASTCCRATLHDLPDQPQCGLRLLEPGRSPLYAQALPRVKRTHAANQMKRVQRANGSLAQVWGRAAPNGLPAENTAKPICLRKNAPTPRRRLRSSSPAFPRLFRTPSGSPPENAQTRSKPAKSDNRTSTRERTTGDPDPRRNRNVTSRKPFCLALCGKQQA